MAKTMDALEEYACRLKTKCKTNNYPQTILITGASSGIGLEAAKMLALINPGHRLIMVARNQVKADVAKEQVLTVLREALQQPKRGDSHHDNSNHLHHHHISTSNEEEYTADNIIPMACDHTRLENVQEFVIQLRKQLDRTYSPSKWAWNGIDVLCCNAAILQGEQTPVKFTGDGIEETFQVNYVVPFLLIQLTMDMMNPNGRIVMTTSGLYERETLSLNGMIQPQSTNDSSSSSSSSSSNRNSSVMNNNNSKNVQRYFEMIDGSVYHFKKCYAQSKLCIVAICYELQRRLQTQHRGGIRVNCFTPGLVTTTGLFRHQPHRPLEQHHNHHRHNTQNKTNATTTTTSTSGITQQQQQDQQQKEQELIKVEKNVSWGAGALVFMAIGTETGQSGGEYWRDAVLRAGNEAEYGIDFRSIPIQMDPELSSLLWDLSCQLVSLSTTKLSSSYSIINNNNQVNIVG